MFSYNYPENMNVGRVCLELSLKPFKQLDDEYINSVCRRLFMQWKPLLQYADGVAVMLWTSDGSEILEYSGNLDDEFEWGRYIGIGNPAVVNREVYNNDDRSLHLNPVVYCENPPVMHYKDLKKIINALKTVGKEMLGIDVSVGETFDPGPEFAYSEFKFIRHNEICKGKVMDAWIHCAASLNADLKSYAAYPDGIPEGTQVGEFLSKQFMALKADVGFDYLWLSNGFGFSLDSWNWKGEVFDGEGYSNSSSVVIESIKKFWDTYTPHTDFVTEVRGSNLSTGMDIAAHGCPIDYIYSNNIVAPPNSPWAAIDSRFGLELVGYMSHIACVPKNGFSFRYYTHDPWWLNSPWFDRYRRSPHDIYLPLAVSRMNENGETEKPSMLNFLSADDSFGDMPERCPIEVIPHILEAYRTFPDAPGIVTWLYPFDYYCKIGLCDNKMDRIMMDDWFIEQAVDTGFPVSTVVSDGVFLKSDLSVYKNTVIVTPVPEANSALEECVVRAVSEGLKVLLYGNTEFASGRLRRLIGVELGGGISGKLIFETKMNRDICEKGDVSDLIIHNPVVSGGGVREVCDTALAYVSNGYERRAYAVLNGQVAWARGSFPHNSNASGRLPAVYKKSECFPVATVMRMLLEKMGYSIRFKTYLPNDKNPIIMMSRNNGGIIVTAFSGDETVRTLISTPYGAPVINNTTVFVENSEAEYNFSGCVHECCRVFVKQTEKCKISCHVTTAMDTMRNDRVIEVKGLENSVVTFMPEINSDVRIYIRPSAPYGDEHIDYTVDEDGYIVTGEISGDILIAWQNKDTKKEYRKLGYID